MQTPRDTGSSRGGSIKVPCRAGGPSYYTHRRELRLPLEGEVVVGEMWLISRRKKNKETGGCVFGYRTDHETASPPAGEGGDRMDPRDSPWLAPPPVGVRAGMAALRLPRWWAARLPVVGLWALRFSFSNGVPADVE